MSVRRLAPAEVQPKEFAFTAENLAWAQAQIAKYPEGRQASAVIPLLWRAQEQHNGWVPEAAIRYIADMLGMAYIRVLEVATFYTMFQLQPVGRKAHVQVCGTTPCMLRGAEELIKVCKRRIHEEPFHLSADGDFSWEEVECLGACVNAPMVQVWKDTYEDLTPESFEKVLDTFARGETPKPGPQNGRQGSEPLGGLTSLTDPALYAVKPAGPANAEAAERPIDAGRPRAAAQTPADPSATKSAAVEKAVDERASNEKREDAAQEARKRSPSTTGSKRKPVPTGTGVRDPEEK
jgi:NADH-quinone oxidoreductase subunit E